VLLFCRIGSACKATEDQGEHVKALCALVRKSDYFHPISETIAVSFFILMSAFRSIQSNLIQLSQNLSQLTPNFNPNLTQLNPNFHPEPQPKSYTTYLVSFVGPYVVPRLPWLVVLPQRLYDFSVQQRGELTSAYHDVS
jgi:hypothetical protein